MAPAPGATGMLGRMGGPRLVRDPEYLRMGSLRGEIVQRPLVPHAEPATGQPQAAAAHTQAVWFSLASPVSPAAGLAYRITHGRPGQRLADRRRLLGPGQTRRDRQRPAQPARRQRPDNRAKGDGDAATWLPPNRSFRCAYVARQVAVKARYELWVTAAERDAIARVLASCPDEPAPTGTAPTAAPGFPVRTGTPGTDPRFDTCTQAKAAGYGPYTRDDPEYDWYDDRDNNGLVCE